MGGYEDYKKKVLQTSEVKNGTRNPSLNLLKRLAAAMDSTLKIEFVPNTSFVCTEAGLTMLSPFRKIAGLLYVANHPFNGRRHVFC